MSFWILIILFVHFAESQHLGGENTLHEMILLVAAITKSQIQVLGL